MKTGMRSVIRDKGRHPERVEGRQPGRPAIGLLTHGAGDPNNSTIWSGVADVARENGVNLICFPGKPLRSVTEFEAQSNVVFDLIDTQSLSGLVIWLAGLAHQAGLDELKEFCERYRPLPIVTVGTLLEGFPGVLVDNYHGMRNVVKHIVETHGHSRIVFIRGPEHHQEAEQRYQAYLDVLSEQGISLDSQLVVIGNFRESGGVRAIDELLDRRKVRFDALIAASDNMAIGAMKSLQKRGIRVPGEVAIASLNDEAQSKFVTPPLTTGPLHFYKQARQGTEMVLTLMRGGSVPERVEMPAELLIRQSCGCPAPSIVRAGIELPRSERLAAGEDGFQRQKNDLVETIQSLELLPPDQAHKFVEKLIDAFVAEVQESCSGESLNVLAEGLAQTAYAGDDVSQWNDFVSSLRRSVFPDISGAQASARTEKLFHQFRVLIGDTAQRGQAYQTLQAREKLRTLGRINQALSITTSLAELAEVLTGTLHLLNIPRCYLSLYEDPQSPVEWSRLVLAYDETGRVEVEAGGLRFPSRQLVPDGFLPAGAHYSLVVEPLYFREDQLGFVLFEADPAQDEIYEILGDQIGGALKRTILSERNIRLYNEAVEARQAAEEANLLKSRFLSMVSHELRTPLSLIVGTIEMMLHEEKTRRVPPLPEVYFQEDAQGLSKGILSLSKDLDCIHASAQHLFRLIGDVLDLASSQAGELRLACEPLNLGKVLNEVALLGESLAREKGLAWRTEIPPHLPLVWGDRTRLRQVTLNLVSNAVKFTECGAVELRVDAGENDVTVSVSDTGMGIPVEEQEAIFDEFRRSERSLGRGYGGMGLGLAISRRLIELHGGEIGVRSTGEEESGAVFSYTLPALQSTGSEREEAEQRSHTVLLLVEQAESSQQLYDHLIQRGYEVEMIGVEENPGWLARVVASPPGAVVLDFQPAAEQGWELIKLLKQNLYTRDIPVIFYSFFADRDRGSMLEMDYLTKPLRSAELFEALERLGLRSKEEKTILIVDDEPRILDMHIRMLESQLPACRILKADNGRTALRLIEQTIPDLVLLDLMMPELDGFEVLKSMRDRQLTRNIPVIILTAQILSKEDMERLQQGVAAVLGKELFSLTEIMSQVEAALARNKQMGREAQRIVHQAMAYINEHYAQPLSRSELAQHLAVSENYLTRCFSQELGVTPTTYLNRRRIKQAKELLESGETNITGVALACGFSDSSYFTRVFRKEVGVTPSAYLSGERAGLS